jgi:hypothetical protein
MTTPPTTSNTTAGIITKITAALANTGVQAVEAAIILDVSFLGWPGIKQVWQGFFGWIASYFVTVAQTGETFGVIDVQVGDEESGMSVALSNLLAAEKTGDAAKIKAAIQAYANAQSSLTHDDGSNPSTG